MKNLIAIVFTLSVFFSLGCNNEKAKEEKLNRDNLAKYLTKTFEIDLDTLNTKLVLINGL